METYSIEVSLDPDNNILKRNELIVAAPPKLLEPRNLSLRLAMVWMNAKAHQRFDVAVPCRLLLPEELLKFPSIEDLLQKHGHRSNVESVILADSNGQKSHQENVDVREQLEVEVKAVLKTMRAKEVAIACLPRIVT
jgi:hypothetical protein